MTYLQATMLAAFSLLTGGALWWMWRKRWAAEQRASQNERLADRGRSADDLAHDVLNLVALIRLNLGLMPALDPPEQEDIVDDVRDAARLAYELFRDLDDERGESSPRTVGEVVRSLARLVRWTGVRVEIQADGEPSFRGEVVDVVRVAENLLLNAAREAVLSGRPEVLVTLSDEALVVRNAVRDPRSLDDRIHEAGHSKEGSVGRGLAIARRSAAGLGWEIAHRVGGDWVEFEVREAEGGSGDAPSGLD